MSDSESHTGHQAFWAAPLQLPQGLRVQHQESLVVPRRGRGGESRLDLARLHGPGGSIQLLVAFRSAPTSKEVLQAKALLAKAADSLRLQGRTDGLVPVLASDVATRSVVELCSREGLGVLDLTGTVVLHHGPFFVHVLGTAKVQRNKPLRLFGGRARRVVRLLLTRPADRLSVAEVAKATSVSYAFAFRVLIRMEREGYVERPSPRGGFRLRDGAGLLRAWAESPDAAPASIAWYYAPNTRPELLAKAASAAAAQGVRVLFTLASGLKPEEVFVGGLPHGAYLSGDDRAFVEALHLQDTTPHNFWILRPDATSDVGPGGLFEGARKLPHGEGASIPQLTVDLTALPARGRDAAEHVMQVYAKSLPLSEGTS
jgi:hypothetical protein